MINVTISIKDDKARLTCSDSKAGMVFTQTFGRDTRSRIAAWDAFKFYRLMKVPMADGALTQMCKAYIKARDYDPYSNIKVRPVSNSLLDGGNR